VVADAVDFHGIWRKDLREGIVGSPEIPDVICD